MQFVNYARLDGRKWHTVVAFEAMPRDHPRTSKEGREVAKFRALGDAFNYVKALQEAPDPIYALVVIR